MKKEEPNKITGPEKILVFAQMTLSYLYLPLMHVVGEPDPMNEIIRQFEALTHRSQVVELWKRVFAYPDAHNEPHFVIDKKLAVDDGLFFVAEAGGNVVGSIMAGYDGHRGWIYSLAVLPEYRGRGIGSRLMRHAEERLKLLGCPKINLIILAGNEGVEDFYRKLGYQTEPRINMGKKIHENAKNLQP